MLFGGCHEFLVLLILNFFLHGCTMLLKSGGIDIFYIDESHDQEDYILSAVAVPFLRPDNGSWHIVWPNYFDAAMDWRRRVSEIVKIPVRKELHGEKLSSGRGRYNYGIRGFTKEQAAIAYGQVLSLVDFLPNASIMSISGQSNQRMYGKSRLERVMHALFQRMRSQCNARNVNAMVFFDQGHPEYRSLYRKAQKYLETGSRQGAWGSGNRTENLPLDMFFKDGNEKDSKNCHFTQLADIVAYSVFMKVKAERNRLEGWRLTLDHGSLYNNIPAAIINTRVSNRSSDGIARIT